MLATLSSATYGATSTVCSYLPQNLHTHNAKELSARIEKLRQAQIGTSNETFIKVRNNIPTILNGKQTKCTEKLYRLNGDYYEDPKSPLKQAWDDVTKCIQPLGQNIHCQKDLDDMVATLENKGIPSKQVEEVKTALDAFTTLGDEQSQVQTQLKEIASFKKGLLGANFEGELLKQRTAVLQRQVELCGDYFEDPKGLLDQAWRAAEEAKKQNPDAEGVYEEFYKLDIERKHNDARLYLLNELLSTPSSSFTDEKLTLLIIAEKITRLDEKKKQEESKGGVDWWTTAKTTAELATEVSIIAATGTPSGGYCNVQ